MNPLSRASSAISATRHPLGAFHLGSGRCAFTVWAPRAQRVEVVIEGAAVRVEALSANDSGYFEKVIEGVEPGTRYWFQLNGELRRPDPASRLQPDGVHGPSEVVASDFAWEDQGWFGIPLRDHVIYELHVGTFTNEGTFEAIIPQLSRLKDLGITAIELMPVAQFPGARNWGYDGVGLFAVQNSYGGPEGLKRLVNAAHRSGLAVLLDVVYNHLGPEGNYLGDFAPYFTDAYSTFWGPAFNFDQTDSDHVRRFFIENALYFQTELHLDGLRLDAVHAIRDFSTTPFLQELAGAVEGQRDNLNRRFHLIAESDTNDPRVIRSKAVGGYGMDAQWSDDFHHALHVLLTGERNGYYSDFDGLGALARTFKTGYAFTGEYSPHRKRRHGALPSQTDLQQFVVCSQNHDQVGNRMMGERLSALCSFEQLKLAAGTVILSPFIPLLFMGEEYGETAPFQYFISHTDEALIAAVREGRKREFKAFHAKGEAPDPQSKETFERCKLKFGQAEQGKQAALYSFYRELLKIRRGSHLIRFADRAKFSVEIVGDGTGLCALYDDGVSALQVIMSFSAAKVDYPVMGPACEWSVRLDSADSRWDGPGGLNSDVIPSMGDRQVRLHPYSLIVISAGDY